MGKGSICVAYDDMSLLDSFTNIDLGRPCPNHDVLEIGLQGLTNDAVNCFSESHANTCLVHQSFHSANESTRPAHHKLHPPLPLQIEDQRINARRVERISTDQQRLKAEHPAELFVLKILACQTPD